MSNTARWSSYEFDVYAPDTAWNSVSGLYIFAGHDGDAWTPYYIGHAENLRERLSNHELWAEACREGATDIHAMAVMETASREAIEQKLIQEYQPKLNEHRV